MDSGSAGQALPLLAVLDVAGTVVNVGDAVPDAFRATMSPLGCTLSDAELIRFRGLSKRDAIREIVRSIEPPPTAIDVVADDAWTRLQSELALRLPHVVRPIPGARETLAWLRAKGVAVWLTTGFDRATVDVVIRSVGWDASAVDGTLSADDVGRGRPAPDLIHEAMRRSGVARPGAVLVVGDTIFDLEAAAAARAGQAVAVLSGAHDRAMLAARPHSAILPSIAELRDWLEGGGPQRSRATST